MAICLDSPSGFPKLPLLWTEIAEIEHLKINIKDIGIQGKRFERHFEDEELRSLLADGAAELGEGPAVLDLDLMLRKSEGTVLVEGQLKGRFPIQCSRCLGPCEVQVHDEAVRFVYLPPTSRQPEELELDADDLDTSSHDGEAVDLLPLVRDHLLLGIPIKPLCREDCLGLCQVCGADRNIDPCSCSEGPDVKTPWVSALQQLNQSKTSKTSG